MAESCLQASMFLTTASSSPERCLCPSLSIACMPYGCIAPASFLPNPSFLLLLQSRREEHPLELSTPPTSRWTHLARSLRSLSLCALCSLPPLRARCDFKFKKPERQQQKPSGNIRKARELLMAFFQIRNGPGRARIRWAGLESSKVVCFFQSKFPPVKSAYSGRHLYVYEVMCCVVWKFFQDYVYAIGGHIWKPISSPGR